MAATGPRKKLRCSCRRGTPSGSFVAKDAAGPTNHRPDPDKDAKQQADEKQCAEYSRHAQTLQQSHCRIKNEHEDEGEDNGKDDLPRYVKRREDC